MAEVFVNHTFWNLLEEIETYLGYLKGNELAHDYWIRVNDDVEANKDEYRPILSAFEYTGNCPDERFKVWRRAPFYVPSGVTTEEWTSQIKQGMDASFTNGLGWATGLKDYCQSITDQITLPSTISLAEGIRTLQTQVISKLEETALDDWAHLGGVEDQWTGLSAAQFRELYDNYDNHLTLYGFYGGYATMAFAMAGATLAHFQAALIPFATDVRDHLKWLLEQWVMTVPRDPKPLPAWVVNVAAIVGDVFTVVSGVNKTVDAVGDIVSRVGSLLKIIDGVTPKGEEKTFPVSTAEEIYTTLTSTLYTEYYQGMKTTLDDLATGQATADIDLGGDLAGETFSSADIAGRLDEKPGEDWFMPEIAPTGDFNNDPNNYGAYY